ncbi:hypothetical protein [Streptomyces sp. NBC_01190]|nr:hypothetical protein OG519_15465 [Streptomyces sp. NBC_01190]
MPPALGVPPAFAEAVPAGAVTGDVAGPAAGLWAEAAAAVAFAAAGPAVA